MSIAHMDFFPAMSLYAIVKSQIRDFGFKSSSDFGVMADFMKPSENYLTFCPIPIGLSCARASYRASYFLFLCARRFSIGHSSVALGLPCRAWQGG